MSDNLKFWNSVCESIPYQTEPVKIGGWTFTTIDAAYQRKRATELWGPYGGDWGLKELVWGQTPSEGKPEEITLEAFFFCPISMFAIASDVKWARDGHNRKKLQTDTLTKALSYLGFNADVFEGKFEDSRYIEYLTKKHAPKPPNAYAAVRTFLVDPRQKEHLPAAIAKIATRCQEGALTEPQAKELHVEALIRTGEFEIAKLQLEALGRNSKGIPEEELARLRTLMKELLP